MGPEQVFDPQFLTIIEAAKANNVEMLKNLVNEVADGVFMMPCFQSEFCVHLMEELEHCANEAKELDLPIRKANVRNSRGVVLNDWGFKNSLYDLTMEFIKPLANILIPSDDHEEWNFESNYTFSVEFKFGEDEELVTHKDSSDITF